MAPRKKKPTTFASPEEQLDLEVKIAEIDKEMNARDDANTVALEAMTKATPELLIKEFLTLKTHAESEGKRFTEHMKPTIDRMTLIKASLHARALASKVNGFPTDEGTAYLSEIVSHKFDPESRYVSADNRVSTGRDATLDWLLDNWDNYGSEGIQLNVSKAIVDRWREEHDGQPPPGLKIDTFKQINIKKS